MTPRSHSVGWVSNPPPGPPPRTPVAGAGRAPARGVAPRRPRCTLYSRQTPPRPPLSTKLHQSASPRDGQALALRLWPASGGGTAQAGRWMGRRQNPELTPRMVGFQPTSPLATPHSRCWRRAGACPWGGAPTGELCTLCQPSPSPPSAEHQAPPERQPAGTGRRSPCAFGARRAGGTAQAGRLRKTRPAPRPVGWVSNPPPPSPPGTPVAGAGRAPARGVAPRRSRCTLYARQAPPRPERGTKPHRSASPRDGQALALRLWRAPGGGTAQAGRRMGRTPPTEPRAHAP